MKGEPPRGLLHKEGETILGWGTLLLHVWAAKRAPSAGLSCLSVRFSGVWTIWAVPHQLWARLICLLGPENNPPPQKKTILHTRRIPGNPYMHRCLLCRGQTVFVFTLQEHNSMHLPLPQTPLGVWVGKPITTIMMLVSPGAHVRGGEQAGEVV